MFDFDGIDGWEPRLTEIVRGIVPDSFGAMLLEANPQSVWNARDLLFDLPELDALIDATVRWLRSTKIAGYHGSRLTDEELDSVQTDGLRPLNVESRRDRLVGLLSAHPRWAEVQAQLDDTIRRHRNREDQVHLALSEHDVVEGDYRRILSDGSEFDQSVARDLLGQEGVQLLAQYGEYRVLKFAIPGPRALAAANPFGGVEDSRARERIPNLVSQVLSSWCFRQARPGSEARAPHCSMMFEEPVPAEWLEGVVTLGGAPRSAD